MFIMVLHEMQHCGL